MSKELESRWEVKIVRDMYDEATFYVSGRSRDEAEEAADREFMDGGVFDFEVISSEYTLEMSPISPRHEAHPVHWFPDQGMVCKICLRTVVWTGIAADDPENRSGKTIPGPWVHAEGRGAGESGE